MNANTKVILHLDNDYIECTIIDYSASDNTLTVKCQEVDKILARNKALQNEVELLLGWLDQAQSEIDWFTSH